MDGNHYDDAPSVPALSPRVIEQTIQNRTFGRVHDLAVRWDGDYVVITGTVPTYYLKQLALHAVMDVMRPSGAQQVRLDLDVLSRVAHSSRARQIGPNAAGSKLALTQT